MESSPSWDANSHSASQEILCILWYRGFRTRYMILCWARWIHFTPCLRYTLISSHRHLGLPSGLFPSAFPTKTLCAFLISSTPATRLTHLIDLDLIIIKLLIMQFFPVSFCALLLRSRVVSSVRVVTRLWSGRPGFGSWHVQRFFPSPPLCPDQLWNPSNLFCSGYSG